MIIRNIGLTAFAALAAGFMIPSTTSLSPYEDGRDILYKAGRVCPIKENRLKKFERPSFGQPSFDKKYTVARVHLPCRGCLMTDYSEVNDGPISLPFSIMLSDDKEHLGINNVPVSNSTGSMDVWLGDESDEISPVRSLIWAARAFPRRSMKSPGYDLYFIPGYLKKLGEYEHTNSGALKIRVHKSDANGKLRVLRVDLVDWFQTAHSSSGVLSTEPASGHSKDFKSQACAEGALNKRVRQILRTFPVVTDYSWSKGNVQWFFLETKEEQEAFGPLWPMEDVDDDEQEFGILPIPDEVVEDEATNSCANSADMASRVFCQMTQMLHDKAEALKEMFENVDWPVDIDHEEGVEETDGKVYIQEWYPLDEVDDEEELELDNTEPPKGKFPFINGGPIKYWKYRHHGNKGTAAHAYDNAHRRPCAKHWLNKSKSILATIFRGIRSFFTGFLMPVFIGILAGMTVSLLGMLIGGGVACMWFKMKKRRGGDVRLEDEDSEEAQPLVLDVEKEIEDMPPPQYVEKE